MATPPDFSVGQVLTSATMNQVGLWLIKTQTIGSTVSSVTVTDVFSADFDVYRVTISGATTSSGTAFMRLQLANLGNHYGSLYYDEYTGSNTAINRTNAAASANISVGGTASTSVGTSFDIHNPFGSSAYTTWNGTYFGGLYTGFFAGSYRVNASFTGISFLMTSGTMTGGIIRVYGYRD